MIEKYLNKIHLEQEGQFDVLKAMPENSVDCMITSPPYNVGILYDNSNDSLPVKDYFELVRIWLSECYRVLKDDGRICVNVLYECNFRDNKEGRYFIIGDYYRMIREVGFGYAGQVDLTEVYSHRPKNTAWGSFLSPSSPYIYSPKEGLLLGYKKQWKKINKGVAYFDISDEKKKEFIKLVSGKWEYVADTRSLTKATFSLDIPLNALKILTYENDIILDPFIGSGTTALACEMLNRRWIGMDVSQKYIDIATNRINEFKEKR